MLCLFVTVKVKPDQRERFLSAIEEDATGSVRDEPGCQRFEVLQDMDKPDTYYFFEVYDNQAALEAHTKTPHFARWSEARPIVVDGDIERVNATRVFPRE